MATLLFWVSLVFVIVAVLLVFGALLFSLHSNRLLRRGDKYVSGTLFWGSSFLFFAGTPLFVAREQSVNTLCSLLFRQRPFGRDGERGSLQTSLTASFCSHF